MFGFFCKRFHSILNRANIDTPEEDHLTSAKGRKNPMHVIRQLSLAMTGAALLGLTAGILADSASAAGTA